ncbi:MAG: glycosyltransferase family 87 protein [Planctomycetota bacterium]
MLGRHQPAAADSPNEPGFQVYTPRDLLLRRAAAVLSSAGCLGVLAWAAFRMVRGSAKLASGDFKHFYWASEAMREGADPYAAGVGGYIYPPLFAWFIQPLIPLGRVVAERAWGVVNMTLIVASLLLAFRIVRARLRGPADWLTAAAVCFFALGLTVEPVRWEMEEGQTDTVMLLSLTLGLFLLDRFPAAAGAVLALATQIKHQAVLFLVYLLIRRRWKPAAAMAVAAPLFALVPLSTMGAGVWSHAMSRAYGYIAAVFTGAPPPEGVNLHPITWELSVSIPSAIARAVETESGVPKGPLAALTLAAAGAAFAVTWALYAARGVPLFAGRGGRAEREHPGRTLIEWAGLVVVVLAFSPQTMVRHSFILLPVHALVAYLLLVPKPGLNRWPLLVGTVVYQLGTRLPPGVEGYEAALAQWRAVGGASWCMLCMWFGLVWTGLGAIRAPYPVQRRAPLMPDAGNGADTGTGNEPTPAAG